MGADLEDVADIVSGEPANQRQRNGAKARAQGISAPKKITPLDEPFNTRDAYLLWDEMVRRLVENGRVADDIAIRVVRVDPQPKTVVGRRFDGNLVAGNDHESPGEQLIERVTDDYHMSARGRCSYEIEFYWKENGQQWSRGVLHLDSPEAIHTQRMARARQGASAAQPSPISPVGTGAPAPQPPAPQPHYGYPPPPYGYAPPAPQIPAGVDPNLAAMLQENAVMRGQLTEVLAAMREGREPNLHMPPPTPTQPGLGSPTDIEGMISRVTSQVTERVIGAFVERMGLGRPQQAAPAAPPPPPVETPGVRMERLFAKVTERIMEDTISRVGDIMQKQARATTAGLGSPASMQQPEEASAETIEPESKLDWESVPVPDGLGGTAKWPDGSTIIFPKKSDAPMGISPMGFLFSNGYAASKLMDVANKLGESAADALKKVGAAGPHVVHRTPSNAVDASPEMGDLGGGGGWPQQ